MTSAMILEERATAIEMSYGDYVAEHTRLTHGSIEGIRRGIADYRAGRVTPWHEVVKELELGAGTAG